MFLEGMCGMRNFWRIREAFYLGILVLLSACSLGAPLVMNSGAENVIPGNKKIFWLDDDRVLFLAHGGEFCHVGEPPNTNKASLQHLAIFDTRTQKLSRYSDLGIQGLCYVNGNVSYRRRIVRDGQCPINEESDLFYGRFGEEVIQKSVPIDPENCLPDLNAAVAARELWRERKAREEKEMNNRQVWMARLQPAHGWLAMQQNEGDYGPLAIYPPGREDSPIKIDRAPFAKWLDKGYQIIDLRYEAFRNAYLVALRDSGTKYGGLWWLYPDGKVEEAFIFQRNGDWQFFNYSGVIPYRDGIVARSARSNPMGLYQRTKNGGVRLIDSGWISEETQRLSPDGCKLAYAIDLRKAFFPQSGPYELHVVDLCGAIN
ncbi:hypothetical protein [Azonexus sp.]|uniref:hypothetical protein n=1 Tax=Azonexus sp. TaxID=1872668 RepID=UPI0027BA2AE4|nr:hypothetical protein [Azonexus sp.]